MITIYADLYFPFCENKMKNEKVTHNFALDN